MTIAKRPRKKSRVLFFNTSFPSDVVKIFGEGERFYALMGLLLGASGLEWTSYEGKLVENY